MHTSKLIEALRKLSPKQLSRFGEWLESPVFHKNADNRIFFWYLVKHAPTFSHPGLTKAEVLRSLVLSKPTDEKLLAYRMNDLLTQLEDYLATERFHDHLIDMPLYLLEQYHYLDLPKHYHAVEAGLTKKLRKYPHRNAAFFKKQMVFKRLQYEQADANQRGYDPNLQDAADALDVFFVIEKLRYACEMQNLVNMFEVEYRMPLIAEVVEWSASSQFTEVAAVQIYRRLFQLLSNLEQTEHFDPVKYLLTAHGNLFEPGELKQLYTLLLNFCTRRINRFNDQHFWYEYLEINKLLLEKQLLLEDGYLPPWRYANLITVGLKTGQVDWTETFLHTYRHMLPESHSENMYRYNLAHFYYHQRKLDQAQLELVRVEFNDLLLNVSARSLLIKIYFETRQEELLLSYLEATRIFLLRNKMLDAQLKLQLKKFVDFTTKLAKVIDRDTVIKLQKKLPPPKGIMHRDWLMEQMQQYL
ncbi:MAG: hypothetical protein KDC34_12395 [Saprospiraceae bacterium]|nr:hypothetical protein [Saprospiraceae bacterium]